MNTKARYNELVEPNSNKSILIFVIVTWLIKSAKCLAWFLGQSSSFKYHSEKHLI